MERSNSIQTTTQTKSEGIQSRSVLLGRSYISITKIESRQPITCQNNQEQMIPPNTRKFMTSVTQVLAHVIEEFIEKMSIIFNSLTFVTKMMH